MWRISRDPCAASPAECHRVLTSTFNVYTLTTLMVISFTRFRPVTFSAFHFRTALLTISLRVLFLSLPQLVNYCIPLLLGGSVLLGGHSRTLPTRSNHTPLEHPPTSRHICRSYRIPHERNHRRYPHEHQRAVFEVPHEAVGEPVPFSVCGCEVNLMARSASVRGRIAARMGQNYTVHRWFVNCF